MADTSKYHPLSSTFRLYAGWLLAWLSIVYVLGYYQALRTLPIQLTIVQEWFESTLILQVTLTTFIFLLMSSVYEAVGRGLWKCLLLAAIGFGLLVLFRITI